jgi:hypothetical protein
MYGKKKCIDMKEYNECIDMKECMCIVMSVYGYRKSVCV